MELLNDTRLVAGYNFGLEPSGRELLVVMIKGTFRLPLPDDPSGRCELHEAQVPLVMVDTFTDEPGRSSPVHEIDFAPRKPRCDILLLGSAYAPPGCAATRVDVEARVGGWRKGMSVFGERHWEMGLSGPRSSPPRHFLKQPISYDVAFGGVDLRHEDPAEHAAFMANPVGRGFHKHLRREWIDGATLPATEEIGHAVTDPRAGYRPMAYGPVGRGWTPRSTFAGTYDEHWQDHHFPFLPPDFDDRFHQSAPADQQIEFPVSPLSVTLTNLTPDGRCEFVIPHFDAPINFFPKSGPREEVVASLDTIVLEPDARRFTLTWRAARPLRKNCFEIAQVLVGRKSAAWWRARDSGKTYYESLDDAIRATSHGAED